MLSVRAVAREIVAAKRDGSMVLISSVNGVVADPGLTAYSASKAGVFQLTRVVARELGPLGIRVNAIGPGPTDTPMMRTNLVKPGYREEVLRRTRSVSRQSGEDRRDGRRAAQDGLGYGAGADG